MTDRSMSWEDHVGYIRESYIDGLVDRGMRLIQEESTGAYSKATLVNDEVTVILGEGFPYLPPRVMANHEVPKSWHLERDGGLCLYTSRDRSRLPWLDPDAFLSRVELWFEKNRQGWPDDPPVLDLEAYIELPWDTRFIIYGDLGLLTGRFITLRCDGGQLRVSGQGKAPKKRRREITGYVADIGHLDEPPRDWNDILERFDESGVVSKEVQSGHIEVLLVRYARHSQHGVLAVIYTSGKIGRQPRKLRSASADRATLGLRAGPSAAELGNKHVYVIGAGAVGSHICDGLSRAGIGRLTVRDYDHLTPGNMTRHLVTDIEHCGESKARAVKKVLDLRPYNRARVTDVTEGLIRPRDAALIFGECDLVVDATADGASTAMLEQAARVTGQRFVTVCLQNEGRTQRLDVVPPLNDAEPLAPTKLLPPSSVEIFEAGCGEPVSPTPPFAVAEAAAMAVRHIVGHLTGKPPTPSGEVRNCP